MIIIESKRKKTKVPLVEMVTIFIVAIIFKIVCG